MASVNEAMKMANLPPAAKDDKAPAPKPEKVSATVANGRTLVVEDEDGVHYNAGPGSLVSLTPAEVKRLRRGGYLMDPDGAQVVGETTYSAPANVIKTGELGPK